MGRLRSAARLLGPIWPRRLQVALQDVRSLPSSLAVGELTRAAATGERKRLSRRHRCHSIKHACVHRGSLATVRSPAAAAAKALAASPPSCHAALLPSQVTLIAAMAYLAMALNIGDVWVRYVDWVLSTPLLLLDLGCEWWAMSASCNALSHTNDQNQPLFRPPRAVLAGMPAAQVLFLCAIDMMMIGGGFAAQMVTLPEQKWPMFVFSCAMFVIITMSLITNMQAIAKTTDCSVEAKTFKFLSVWTLSLWAFYPVLFILDNARVLSVDVESVIHCILDTLAKGALWRRTPCSLARHRPTAPCRFTLTSRSHGAAARGCACSRALAIRPGRRITTCQRLRRQSRGGGEHSHATPSLPFPARSRSRSTRSTFALSLSFPSPLSPAVRRPPQASSA